jgi:beta-lactamase class A
MKLLKLLILMFVGARFIAPCYADPDQQAIEAKVNQRIKEFGATDVAVYWESGNQTYMRNPNEIFHAASTMKVAVMMEIFHKVDQQKLSLDQPVPVKNEFASIIDGSPFSLTEEEDSDQEIYKLIGTNLTLRELVERMINHSSNLATDIVIQLAKPQDVMALMKQIGAKDMTVLRGVEDEKAYEAGKNNTTSAGALATCLKAILISDIFSESSRKQMFDILLSQTSKSIGKGIHAEAQGLKVASKDGWITEIHHDAAIIQDASGKTSILVILTRGVKEEADGEKLVETLANDLWQALR